jgi:hypothetical protein
LSFKINYKAHISAGFLRGLTLIKPFTIRDSILVANLQKQGTFLDLEERLIHPRSPLSSALLSSLLPTTLKISTFILDFADENGHYQGLAQTRSRPGRPEQDVVFVAPSLEYGNGSHALWQRLLTHMCVKAGEAGYQRIYARLDNEGDALQIFKNIGFAPYAEENIFRLDFDLYLSHTGNPVELRKQKATDSWSLQRLYAVVTPQAVQAAEGLAQGQWQVNKRFLGSQGHRFGYVWEKQGEILAAMNFHTGKDGGWFRMMVHPDVRDEATSLVIAGLKLFKNLDQYPVYCSLRTYQTELVSRVRECGFRQLANETIMVKHTTVRAKDFLTKLLPAFESSVEAKHAAPTAMIQAETTPPAKTNGTPRWSQSN